MSVGRQMWTLHDGDVCPVHDETPVIVIRRRIVDDCADHTNGLAKEFDWNWANPDDPNKDPEDDVVSYRLDPFYIAPSDAVIAS